MRPLLSVVLCFCTTALGQYVLQHDYTDGSGFADKFNFFTDDDPTHGYVNYVDYNTAVTEGLYQTENERIVYLGVDHTNVATGRGRNSLRLESKAVYNHGLFIIDLQHMPGGQCAVWPALWFLGPDWPTHGEFDIIENINTAVTNQMSLKVNETCYLEGEQMYGQLRSRDCNINDQNLQGCDIDSATVPYAYGQGFNDRGGGVYATEWTSDAISVWYFAEDRVPYDIDSTSPDPSKWGVPLAKFVTTCALDENFLDQQLIINIDFCGDWAGGIAWDDNPSCSAKAAKCSDYVQGNPSDFANTFWQINSLKVYTFVPVTTTTASTTTTAISTSSSTLSTTTVTTTTTPISTSTTSSTISSTVNPLSASASSSTSNAITSTISSTVNPISTSASSSASSASSSLTSSVLSSSTTMSSVLSSTTASHPTSRSTADPINTSLTTTSETTIASTSSSSSSIMSSSLTSSGASSSVGPILAYQPTSSHTTWSEKSSSTSIAPIFTSMSTASSSFSTSPSSTGSSGSSIGPISASTHTTIRSWLDMSQSSTTGSSVNSILPSPTTGSVVLLDWSDWSEDDSSASTATMTHNSSRPTSNAVHKTTLTTTWVEPCATGLITKTMILTTTHCSCTEEPPASILMTTETVKVPVTWPVPNPFVVTMPVTTTSFVAKASKTSHVNGWAVDGDSSASTVTVHGYQGGSAASTVTIKGFQGDESTMTVTATHSQLTVATTVTLEPVAPTTEAASQTIPTIGAGAGANAWSPAGSDSGSNTGSTSPSTAGPWIATYTGAAGAVAVSATMVVSAVSLCVVLMQLSGF
ncbi:hypothetical protein LTR99_010892 [Exophiala xenobiotica]|uniref:endo-1,3(4)-beta-glucanase n=1 Tax=Vermiconidia calcicola TaxID=1690605 RepID=A0AAV9PS27_9PEZI|nr:hypothetical protein LTR41_006818 [Exophiala xenobiotica]KAK5528154.1 hypothetical protein LTR25_010669 [Vermiconidia calcicola]KAK5532556.1 hypothetical protein LTR23_009612 [Chaetothyriales sp. CCFEE 6169]KAK5216171.1 hypothetical protein LTR72_010742 [Exophiala xenobiotica]KAK5222431.1 hypothetical protein LTR47_010590 [Exophiala xenobiotica]